MKRIALVLALSSVLLTGVRPVVAGDWGQPVQYGYPPQQDHPVLRKVLIGAGLVGIGLLIGRATAPQPQYGYYQQPQQPFVPHIQQQYRVPVVPQQPFHYQQHYRPNCVRF